MVESFAEELTLYIKTGAPLIYVTAVEVERALLTIQEACKTIRDVDDDDIHVWRNTSGWDDKGDAAPNDVFDNINEFAEGSICILVNYHWYVGKDAADPIRIQQFIDGYYVWKGDTPRTVIILSPTYDVASELDRLFQVIQYTLPTREQLGSTLDAIIDGTEGEVPTPSAERREKVLDAAAGLTDDEFENAATLSILKDPDREVNHLFIMEEKAKTLTKSGFLDYWPATDDLTAVGGMENLKDWLKKRESALTAEAREFGLPLPKGMLLLGLPGCGKSLLAKCVAKQWDLQLIRLDLSKIFGSLVGQSEERMRMVQAQVEALAPCVLWLDEAEKGLAGAKNTADTDSGVTKRIFGSLLSWMQDRPTDKLIYMVITMNDVLSVPPELQRKGRLDEIFWIDLPTEKEKEEIFKIHLSKRNRLTPKLEKDLAKLSLLARDFSGAELESVVEDSLFNVFFDKKKEITFEYLKEAIEGTVPLARTRAEEIADMREWASERCKPAQRKEEKAKRTGTKRRMKMEV